MADLDPVGEWVAAQAGKSESAKQQARIVSEVYVGIAGTNPSKWNKTHVFACLSGFENHSRNTQYNYAVQLKALHRFYGREDLAKLVKPPRRAQTLKIIPSDDEVARMITIADKSRDRLIVQVISRTGVRVGELCHLNIGDIDLENRQIHVRARGMWSPKGFKERIVLFDSDTAEQIKNYLQNLETNRLFDLSESYVRRIVKNLAVKARVKDAERVTPHSLRHAFAVHFLQHGGDVRSLQKILGHADLSTTAIYLTYTEEAVARAYDKVFEKASEEAES